ncbi:MAG: histidine kinase dimerization/phospho-acceptor domain-containing protein, partial [Kiritimatiellales bacterium]
MNTFHIIILLGLFGNIILGLFVLLANPKRLLNIGFAILSVLIILWLGSMFFGSSGWSEPVLLFWIRQTSAAGGMIPLGFFFMHTAVANPGITTRQIIYKLRYWILAGFAVLILCHSSIFALSADPVSETAVVPPTDYGWGFSLFIAYFAIVIIAMGIGFWTANKTATGVQKEELCFLQLGGCISLIFGVSLLVASELFDNQQISGFMPLAVIVLDGFVAYGIATRRIMTASVVLQRTVAYVLMTIYLIVLYIFSVRIGHTVFWWLAVDPSFLSQLFGALVVAFSVAPAHGWMQAFAHRLFPHATSVNVDDILKRAGHIFQEVSTEDNLAAHFSELIMETFDTTRLILLRTDKSGGYLQRYPVSEEGTAVSIDRASPLVQLLRQEHDAITVDMLQRMRPSSLINGARRELESLGAAAILGSFMRKEMKTVLLLFPKKSGRIYDLHDQRALQLLCDQLAVALENANLYTTVQNGKIYNEILLDSLTSGIVAVNSDCIVTVFNQRAQRQTGLAESAVVSKPMTVLPPALLECLETVQSTQAGFRDRDMCIMLGDEEIPIRVSGSVFRSHTGSLLGALLAFNDMTVLKKMEEQIRRTDRLSSIGTLAAGMAHEIKNPLVTIKTFTQLLPQQYSDTEFRHTFFDLVGQEVKRIDAIVNRLLNFARPAKAALKPVSLHEVIENSLRLVEQQLAQHEIILDPHLDARRHIVEADAEQLNQTFINFFLNAVHSMSKGGTLTVRTSVIKRDISRVGGSPDVDCIQADVQDTGCGIAPENLSKIFDPFFTT